MDAVFTIFRRHSEQEQTMRPKQHLFVCFVPSPGDYGKLGHGNSQTHKTPKLIEGNLAGKVTIAVIQLLYLYLYLSTTQKVVRLEGRAFIKISR